MGDTVEKHSRQQDRKAKLGWESHGEKLGDTSGDVGAVSIGLGAKSNSEALWSPGLPPANPSKEAKAGHCVHTRCSLGPCLSPQLHTAPPSPGGRNQLCSPPYGLKVCAPPPNSDAETPSDGIRRWGLCEAIRS